ncbi:MAG: response regulator transcription factor [Candidatus Promineifilaceae bacterium]
MSKIKVVSVDDHPLIHEAVRSLLAGREDMELVAEGYSGDQLFPLLEEHRPDVLVLDLMMPQHENGLPENKSFAPLQALAELRQRHPNTAVIILSQFLHKGIAQGAIEHGVKGYLLKSDNLSLNLPAAIEQVSRGGVYFSVAFSREMFSVLSTAQANLLTEKQKEVIMAIARNPNATYAGIADELCVATRTVKGHLANVYQILEVNNATACIIRCMQLGLIPFIVDENGARVGDP